MSSLANVAQHTRSNGHALSSWHPQLSEKLLIRTFCSLPFIGDFLPRRPFCSPSPTSRPSFSQAGALVSIRCRTKLRSSRLISLDFWTWFPIGPAGIRTLFLFICGLSIIVLRISQYHIGVRASNSTFHAFTKYFFSIQTVETWIFYSFSSTLFAFIYIWTVPETANLGLIAYHSGDRARLNERALFFFSYMAVSAAVQSLFHFYHDEDKIIIDVSRRGNGDAKSSGDSSATLKNVVSEIPAILAQAVQRALTDILITLVVYFLFLRSWTWGWALVFLRPFYNLPKTNMLPPGQPADMYVVLRCFMAGFLLYSIWKTANHAFSTFMVKEPLKNGRPLTSESKDPNGSLLSGLKSKKSQIRVGYLRVLEVHLLTTAVLCPMGIGLHCSKRFGPSQGHLRGH